MVEYGHNVVLQLSWRHASKLLLPGDDLRDKNLSILRPIFVPTRLRGVLLAGLAALHPAFGLLLFHEGRLVAGDLRVLELGEDAVAESIFWYSLWMTGCGTVVCY